jgi:hypothetical protein
VFYVVVRRLVGDKSDGTEAGAGDVATTGEHS